MWEVGSLMLVRPGEQVSLLPLADCQWGVLGYIVSLDRSSCAEDILGSNHDLSIPEIAT